MEDPTTDTLRRAAGGGRPSVVVRPGVFLTLVIASVIGAGYAIFWLLRSMKM